MPITLTLDPQFTLARCEGCGEHPLRCRGETACPNEQPLLDAVTDWANEAAYLLQQHLPHPGGDPLVLHGTLTEYLYELAVALTSKE